MSRRTTVSLSLYPGTGAVKTTRIFIPVHCPHCTGPLLVCPTGQVQFRAVCGYCSREFDVTDEEADNVPS